MTVVNVTPPVVSGTPKVGQTLSTTNGTWTFDEDYLTYEYAWERCDADGSNPVVIPGATLHTYGLVSADLGHAMRSLVTPTEHTNPVTPVDPVPGNGIITTGGTYGGVFNGQITISTTSLVTFDGLVQTYTAGTMMKTSAGTPPNLVIQNSRLTGGSWRILDCDIFDSITMEHCTIVKTAGITLVGNGDILMRYNRHTNIQRVSGGVGNFLQVRLYQSGSFEVAWNEIINEYNKSDPEDLFSIYHSSSTNWHDNYLQGQFRPGNGPGSSQNGITLDGYGGSGQHVDNNIIQDNILVRTLSIAVFPTGTGPASGNRFLGNRYTNAGYLDDGVTRNYYGYQGMSVKPGGSDNQAHDNVLGAMKGTSQGSYSRGNDGEFSGEPRGNGNGTSTGAWTDNTHMAPAGGTITRAMEDAEWDLWQSKLTLEGITIGAP